MSNFMKIKLLHAVLRDGHRVEAGQTGEIDPEIAAELIAAGAAVAVEEPEPAAGNAAPKEPEPFIPPEANGNASPAALDETKGEPAPTSDPKAAKDKKPAKEGE